MLSLTRYTVLMLAALSAAPAVAQIDIGTREDPGRLLILMQGFRDGALSGSGLSSAFDVSVTDLGSANPAALSGLDQATAGLAYRFETSIPEGYIAGIEYQAINGARPQGAAVAVPLGAWTVGASYGQRYAAEMDFGCITRTTKADPDGGVDDYCLSQSARLETVSPQATYRRVFQNGSELAFGLRLGVGFAQSTAVIDSLEGSFSDTGTQVAVGVRYQRPGAFGLAAYYESALRIKGSAAFEGEGLEPVDQGGPTGGGIAVEVRDSDGQLGDAIPARLGASAEIEVSPRLHFGADAAWVFWKAAWDGNDQLKNNAEAALWGRLDLSERALVSAGLRWQDRDRWEEFESVFDYSGRAIYLMLGGAVTLDRLRLDAALADSHLLSGESQRQTIVKVGASVRL